MNVCIFVAAAVRETRTRSVTFLQDVDLSQLALAKENGIENLRRATRDLVTSQTSSSRIESCAREFNPAICAEHKWLSGCAIVVLVINHSRIQAAAMP